MARKRMVDPNIWLSQDFSKLSILAKLVWIGLFSNADDEGRGRANPSLLKSIIFPYDEQLTSEDVKKALSEITQNMSVKLYTHDENEYYQINSWEKWQSIQRPQKSSIPAFDEKLQNEYDSDTVQVQYKYDSDTVQVQPNRKEENRKENNRKELLPEAETAPSQTPVICLILNDKSEYQVSNDQVDKWSKLYPDVNIMQELRCMCGWLDANPKKRKTSNGILKFINNWLAKEQDKGSKSAPNSSHSKQSPSYDLEALSKRGFFAPS